uniref:Elongation of very long chain fatty acids protein n=1 Tax=Megaselia scalaris TaxID=36166 RepID=T1GUL5_MEGSC
MEPIANPIEESYYTRFYNFLVDMQDPRTSVWPLMGSPTPLICILIVYLLFCNYIGPYLMKDREPFELKKTLIVYNFLQVLCSAYIVYELSQCGWGFKDPYNWLCEPVPYDRSPKSMRMCRICYFYYLNKLVELLDTVFFIMRKKFTHVTFLHVYHHFSMPAASFVGVKYLAGGHGTFFGFMNANVHIVMYSYYLLAAFGPKIRSSYGGKSTLQSFKF